MDEVELFNRSYKWAEHKCSQMGLKTNRENIRKCLGKHLYEIRFPLMTVRDFVNTVCPTKILTGDETAKIFEYISSDEFDRCALDVSSLGFKVHPRFQNPNISLPSSDVNFNVLSVQLLEDSELERMNDSASESPTKYHESVSNLLYAWQKLRWGLSINDVVGTVTVIGSIFCVDQRIELVGLGIRFDRLAQHSNEADVGPNSESNCECEFTVKIEPRLNIYGHWSSCGTTEKVVVLSKQCDDDDDNKHQIFFEHPITCDASDLSANPYNVCICYEIQTANKKEVARNKPKIEAPARTKNAVLYTSKRESSVTFDFRFKSGGQVVEILFKLLPK